MQTTMRNSICAAIALLLASCTEVSPGDNVAGASCPSPDTVENAEIVLEAASTLERASSYLASSTWTSGSYVSRSTLVYVSPDRFDLEGETGRLIIVGDTSYHWLGDMGPAEAPLDPRSMLFIDELRSLVLGSGVSSVVSTNADPSEDRAMRRFTVTFCPDERFNIQDKVEIWVDDDGNPAARRITGTMDGKPFVSEVRYSRLNDPGLQVTRPPSP